VNLRAIKAAGRAELYACSVAAARNTHGLLHDAETLAGSGSAARAYAVAALAVEECGKAGCLAALAVLPQSMRMQAPVGRMLEWHQLKQIGGLLIAALTFDEPGLAHRLAAMPAAQVVQILSILSVHTEETDRLKRRGLYVDMDRYGRIREPSEITDAEVTDELARARQAAASAAWLLTPQARVRLENPSAEAVELACALAGALTRAGHARTPEAAADVMLKAVSDLRDNVAARRLTVGDIAADGPQTGLVRTAVVPSAGALRPRPAGRRIGSSGGLVLLSGGLRRFAGEDSDPYGHHEQRCCLARDLRWAAGQFLVQEEPGQPYGADRVDDGDGGQDRREQGARLEGVLVEHEADRADDGDGVDRPVGEQAGQASAEFSGRELDREVRGCVGGAAGQCEREGPDRPVIPGQGQAAGQHRCESGKQR
jgi:AbiV family abortive infection protein